MSEAYENDMAEEEAIFARIAAAEADPEPATEKPLRKRRGKGRPKKINARAVARWRRTNSASVAETAEHFGISASAVSKACAEHAEAVRLWVEEREDQEWRQLEEASDLLLLKIRKLNESAEEADRIREAFAKGEATYEEQRDASAAVLFWANSLGTFDRERFWRS